MWTVFDSPTCAFSCYLCLQNGWVPYIYIHLHMFKSHPMYWIRLVSKQLFLARLLGYIQISIKNASWIQVKGAEIEALMNSPTHAYFCGVCDIFKSQWPQMFTSISSLKFHSDIFVFSLSHNISRIYILSYPVMQDGSWMGDYATCGSWHLAHATTYVCSSVMIVEYPVWTRLVCQAAFMLILRRQNQRFEMLIQNADPKRPSREYCSCFPREEDDFVSMHCALFEAIVRAQVNRKGVYMTSFKRGYMWFCVHASTRISVLL